MGYWTTLHLFDEHAFYSRVLPTLKGEKGSLNQVCLDFLSTHSIGGIAHFSEEKKNQLNQQFIAQVIEISNAFDPSFRVHLEFNQIADYEERRCFLNALSGHYDFCKFFEYYLFETCADFFPHLPIAKAGLLPHFKGDTNSLSYDIICELEAWNEFLSADNMGIRNWIGHEDVELLYLDKENLKLDDSPASKGFLTLLEVAYNNNLGLLLGVDMQEHRLALLPAHKLVQQDTWANINHQGLLFNL